MFEIVIERFDEEFEIIDSTNNLEKAIEIAKKYPIEKYKSIRIDKLDEYGNIVKIIELEVK